MDRGTHGTRMIEPEEWMRRKEVKEKGRGGVEGREEDFERSQLQKAKAGEETGCRGERIMELNVWAD